MPPLYALIAFTLTAPTAPTLYAVTAIVPTWAPRLNSHRWFGFPGLQEVYLGASNTCPNLTPPPLSPPTPPPSQRLHCPHPGASACRPGRFAFTSALPNHAATVNWCPHRRLLWMRPSLVDLMFVLQCGHLYTYIYIYIPAFVSWRSLRLCERMAAYVSVVYSMRPSRVVESIFAWQCGHLYA